jgi:hypothetical protein
MVGPSGAQQKLLPSPASGSAEKAIPDGPRMLYFHTRTEVITMPAKNTLNSSALQHTYTLHQREAGTGSLFRGGASQR